MIEPGVNANGAGTTPVRPPGVSADLAPDGLVVSLRSADRFRSLLDAAVSAVGAFGAVLALADVTGLKIVATVGFDPADIDAWRDIGAGARVPLAECLRENRRVGVDSREVSSTRYPALSSVRHVAGATACVPLRRADQALGVLGVAFAASRVLSEREWLLLEAIAREQVLDLDQQVSPVSPWPDQDPGAGEPPLGGGRASLTSVVGSLLGAGSVGITLLPPWQLLGAGLAPSGTGEDPFHSWTAGTSTVSFLSDVQKDPAPLGPSGVMQGSVGRYVGASLRSPAGEPMGSVAFFDESAAPWPDTADQVIAEVAELLAGQLMQRSAGLELSEFTSRLLHSQALSEALTDLHTVAQVQRAAARHVSAAVGAVACHVDSVDLLDGMYPGPVSVVDLGSPTQVTCLLVVWPFGTDPTQAEQQLAPVRRMLVQAVNRLSLAEQLAAAQARQAFLAEASVVLDTPLSSVEALPRLARMAVPALADLCVVHLQNDGELGVAALSHVDRAQEAMLTGRDSELTAVLHGFVAEVFSSGEAVLATADGTASAGTDLAGLLHASGVVCVPLACRGRRLGTMTVARGQRNGSLVAADLAFFVDLGQRAALAIDNALLYAERDSAVHELQRELLPSTLPDVIGGDLAVAYLPAGSMLEVGGDFYDAWRPDSDPKALLVAIGDVCGRGARAAGMTGVARHTLRAASRWVDSPGLLLREVNTGLVNLADSERFTTACVIRLEPLDDGFSVLAASAGHPPTLLLRADGTVESIECPGGLLGLWPGFDAEERQTWLGPGDLLLLYTDGVTEARNGGHMFGEEGLIAVLSACPGESADVVVSKIIEAVGAHRSQGSDDVAVLAFRVEPGRVPR